MIEELSKTMQPCSFTLEVEIFYRAMASDKDYYCYLIMARSSIEQGTRFVESLPYVCDEAC